MEYLAHSDYLKLSKAKQKAHDKQWALYQLNDIKPSDAIYTLVKRVSSSGMSRSIGVYRVIEGDIQDISYFVANALGWKLSKDGGVTVGGCGMDMGFHLVYSLSWVLFPNGTTEPHGTRNGEPDCDGGYALKHKWL
jgi:hypothetical protein